MANTVDDWMYNHEQYVQQQENFLGQISGAIITIMDENRRLRKEVERLKEYETRFNGLVNFNMKNQGKVNEAWIKAICDGDVEVKPKRGRKNK